MKKNYLEKDSDMRGILTLTALLPLLIAPMFIGFWWGWLGWLLGAAISCALTALLWWLISSPGEDGFM